LGSDQDTTPPSERIMNGSKGDEHSITAEPPAAPDLIETTERRLVEHVEDVHAPRAGRGDWRRDRVLCVTRRAA